MSRLSFLKITGSFPFLTTWTIWRRLHLAAGHPIYWRTLLRFPAERSITYTIGFVYFFILLFTCVAWQSFASLKDSSTLLLITIFLLSSSVYAIIWMIGTSTAINKAHIQSTYEQFSLAPSGALGTSWAIWVAVLHYNNGLYWIDLGRRIFTIMVVSILLLLLFIPVPQQDGGISSQFISLFLQITILAATSYIEHVQTIIMGGLVGMLAPTLTRTRPDIHFLAVALFVFLQVISYAVSIMVGILVIPYSNLAALATGFAVFYMLREGFITMLWRTLAYRLNANVSPNHYIAQDNIPVIKNHVL